MMDWVNGTIDRTCHVHFIKTIGGIRVDTGSLIKECSEIGCYRVTFIDGIVIIIVFREQRRKVSR